MSLGNVERRINAAAVLIRHTRVAGVANAAKSSYYRSAITILCTIVEGLVYELVRKNTAYPHKIGDRVEYLEKHVLPVGIFSITTDFAICEKKRRDVLLNDDGVSFGKMNTYLKNNGIVNLTQYRALNGIRKERNKIHVQGLTGPDTGYTRAKIERLGKVIRFLLAKF